MIGNCVTCGKEIEIHLCCYGKDCGCMGLPIEPPVCSNKCWDLYLMKLKEELKMKELKEQLNYILHNRHQFIPTDSVRQAVEEILNLINQYKKEILIEPHNLLRKCLDDNYELRNGRELEPRIRDEIEEYFTRTRIIKYK